MDNINKPNWQPLRELVPNTSYTMEYLSLMARKKQLKVKKIGRVWHSTVEYIKEFEDAMRERKEERNKQLQERYRDKVKKEAMKEMEKSDKGDFTHPVSPAASHPSQEGIYQNQSPLEGGGRSPSATGRGVSASEKSIFDSVQKELEEVLQEIKDRDERLRKEYRAYQDIQGGDEIPESYSKAKLMKEKQETAVIADHLITDMGKLLKTANKVQEEHGVPINIRQAPLANRQTDDEPRMTNDDFLSPFIHPVPAAYYQRRGHHSPQNVGLKFDLEPDNFTHPVSPSGEPPLSRGDLQLEQRNNDLYLDERSSKIFWILAGALVAILVSMTLFLFLEIGV